MKKNKLLLIALVGAALTAGGCQAAEEQAQAAEAEISVQSDAQSRETEEAAENRSEEGPVFQAEETYLVENPGDGYYAGEEEALSQPSFELRLISEQANRITDEEEWAANHQITIPEFPYTDGSYEYAVSGNHDYAPVILSLYDIKRDEPAIRLDFSAYQYSNDFAEEDRDYIEQYILWAKAEDGILYTATAHNTYAASSPHTAYVTAIDPAARKVLWKSDPLSCNSNSFEIVGDSIVCGYGFTAEPDFLNILDKKTGRLQEQIPVKSKPQYIVRDGQVLYVRTYDTDYRFEIVEKTAGAAAGRAEPGQTAGDPAEEPAKAGQAGGQQSAFMQNYNGEYEKEIRLAGTKICYRMAVTDAALGNRMYGLIKSSDAGVSWEEVSRNPFEDKMGMGIDFTFLDEKFGFAALTHNGGDSAELLVTADGGRTYQDVVLEEYQVTLDNDFTYAPYDFPQMPYEEDGAVYVLCGQGADGDYNGGDEHALAKYKSLDHGQTFSFEGIVAAKTEG